MEEGGGACVYSCEKPSALVVVVCMQASSDAVLLRTSLSQCPAVPITLNTAVRQLEATTGAHSSSQNHQGPPVRPCSRTRGRPTPQRARRNVAHPKSNPPFPLFNCSIDAVRCSAPLLKYWREKTTASLRTYTE